MVKPLRFPWDGFQDVLIHTDENSVKKHPAYQTAKAGDVESAMELVFDSLNDIVVLSMLEKFGESPTLIKAV